MPMLLRAVVFVAVSVLLAAVPARAEEPYPNKPVRIIVPFAPAGPADIVARLMAQKLSEEFGKQFYVENHAGAGGNIGAGVAARAPADGYSLMLTSQVTVINPHLYKSVPYDPDKDFTPVSGLGFSNQFLVMTASSPLMTVRDVIAAAKAKPGELQYGTIGLGGSSHINMVLFESMAGIKMTPVHYRGGAPLVTDLLGGHVSMSFLSGALVDQGIKAGKLRPAAIATKRRLPQYPNVPTVDESGVPGFEAVSWYGLWAPAGTPPDVVAKINADVQKIFADDDFRVKFLEPNFLGAVTGSPAEFSAFIKAEAAKWGKLVKEASIKVE